MYKENLSFNKDGKFVILQVSDAQDLLFVRRTMLKMLDRADESVKPDLVVLTGDNILGNHVNDAGFGTRQVVFDKKETYNRMRKALSFILKPLDERKIPFAFIFGNHDDMNAFTKEEQAEIYKSYNYCIEINETLPQLECDTYNIPIYSSDKSRIAYNIWMLDSAGHDENGENGFEYVSKETLDWYVSKSEELKSQNNGKPVDSLMFQHIPMPETIRLLKECKKGEPNSVKKEDKYYTLDPKLSHGSLGEYPCVCEKSFGQFERIKEQGDVRAIVFGHDHLNCFEGTLDGINIVQSPCASFRCYGNSLRGVRVFELDENDTGHYHTYTLTYFDLCGKGLVSRLRNILDADEKVVEKTALLIGTGLAFCGAAAFCISKQKSKKRCQRRGLKDG
jgi:predicted phosphodiesterase